MRVRVAGDEDRGRFNSFVSGSRFADVLQSYEWGEVKRAGGWTPVRILVEEADEPVGAVSMLIRRPASLLPPIAYSPRGPVLDFADESALKELIPSIKELSRGSFLFTCDPAVENGSQEAEALMRAGMGNVSSGGFGGVQPKAVMVLDLEPPPGEIFGGFKSKWRYNIRLAERKGVVSREAGRDDLPAFYDLLAETARRDRFFVRARPYFESLWDCLTPARMLKMFVAEYHDRPIAGIILFCMGDRAVYSYGASSSSDRNVMPNHLIQWHAIRWAKSSGYKTYDFRGVSPLRNGRPLEPHLAGLNRFKEGFGARYVEYAGQFDLPLKRSWYAIWRTAAPIAIRAAKRLRPPSPD